MSNSIYKEFGERLAYLRKKKGLTQAEVAKKMGTVQSTYSGYELGTRKVTIELIRQFAQIFDVSPDYLVMGENFEVKQKQLLTQKEEKLLFDFRSLSNQGQDYICQTMDMAVYRYKKDNNPADMEISKELA